MLSIFLSNFPFAICSSFFSDSFRVVRRKIAERMATMTASEVRQDLAEEVAKVSVWISFYIVLLHLFFKKDFCRQSAGHIKKASLYPPPFYLYPPSFYLYPSILLSVSSTLSSVSYILLSVSSLF